MTDEGIDRAAWPLPSATDPRCSTRRRRTGRERAHVQVSDRDPRRYVAGAHGRQAISVDARIMSHKRRELSRAPRREKP